MAVTILVGTAFGFLSGLGIGGGSLLILWLTQVLEMEQSTARAINLLFFLPAAAVAVLFRWRQGVLPLKQALPAMFAGMVSAAVFTLWSRNLDVVLLRKGFGILLLATGLREILCKPKKQGRS